MRIVIILLFTSVFISVAETGYTQNARVTINKNKVALKEVLNEIENQTDYLFIYNNEVNTNNTVSVRTKNGTVRKVLTHVLKDSDIDFLMEGNHIILSYIEGIINDKDEEITKTVQQQGKTITGKVTDTKGEPLPGVTIILVGTSKGVIADNDGAYSIEVKPSDKLAFTFIGMEGQIIEVGSRNVIDVVMGEKIDELEEVTVVAFGKQKKASVISSIETVKVDDLRVPSSNLTTAFAGRMAGMISYQTSGEPGQDNANFFIRGVTSFGTGKVDPLILIDNIEMTTSDLSRLHPDDIQSFSILKDATGTAVYGARGANGVVLITTKEGKEGKLNISVRLENSFSSPTKEIELADPITYMQMANEAAKTRDPLSAVTYSSEKIDNTIRGGNPYVYPAVDWMDVLFKDMAINQKVHLNITGGGEKAQYYISASFAQDNGILKVDKNNNFNNNIDLKKYLVRSNININLTNTTQAKIRVHGTFDDYTGPVPGASWLYNRALNVSPVRFPPYFEPDIHFEHEKHTLFGNDETGGYMNPYAEMVKGYRQESKTMVLAQFELYQELNHWVDGLEVRALGNTIRNASFDLSRSYNPYYYKPYRYDRLDDVYYLEEINTEQGTEYLSYQPGYKNISSSFYGEFSANYNQSFRDDHAVNGMLVYIIRNSLDANAASLAASLPMRNMGLSGRFTYAYKDRYLSEFNFGYNGTEKFDEGNRWGFFPSFGVGWIASNEPFFEGVGDVISNLKIKGTYGSVGNDQIGATRFFYLSDVNITGGYGFSSGYNFGKRRTGVRINNYPNPKIGWEVSYKTNLGLELGLFDGVIEIIADLFHERRTNILQTRADIPTEMGLWSTPQANVGIAVGKGVDASLDYNKIFNNDLWVTGRATFTFAKSKFEFYEEPDYDLMGVPWRSRVGKTIRQQWGYVAERLFIDELDVHNSSRQDFGEYGPGDIKYKDMNGDGVINNLDMAPIGHPTMPEINYGFGLSTGYKNFDASFFFQGSGQSSFWINAHTMTPFIRSGSLENGLAKFIADDYWTETSQNPYANWPRLSNYRIDNNTQTSTWYMRDGQFLRLKSIELGYSLPGNLVKAMNMNSVRFYLNGTNLLLFSNFDLWDVEMGGNGLGYPLQRVLGLGLNVNF